MFDIFSSDNNDNNDTDDSNDTENSIETETETADGEPLLDPDALIDTSQDIWGERGGPSELPAGTDASVTPLSASSAQLLSHGGRVGSAYCKILYIPRGGWPANPEPGLLDRLTAHSSAGVQVKLRVEPMGRKRAASEFKRRVKQKNKELYSKRQAGAPDAGTVADEKKELDATLRAIEGGRESIYWVGVYFVVRASRKAAVDDAADAIKRDLAKDDLGVTTLD